MSDGLLPGQQGTIFPEEGGGGSPGEQDPGQDITGLVLPGLSDPDPDLAAGTGSSLSNVPQAPDAPAPDVQVAGGDIPPPAQRRPRTAADRIAQLTKQYRHEQRARGELEQKLDQALELLRQGGQQQSFRAPAPRQAAQEAADALGLGSTPPDVGAQPITAESIRGIIQQSFTEYEARRNQRDSEIQRMQASHEASFKEAAEELPELLDTRSSARAYFDQLYAVSPLKTLPDGPYQIALQVRGLLADEARRAPSPERKVQAGVVVPAGAPVDVNSRAALQKEYDRLTNLRKQGDNDFQTYKRLRMVRDQLLRKR